MAVDDSHGIEVGQDIGTGNTALIITIDNNDRRNSGGTLRQKETKGEKRKKKRKKREKRRKKRKREKKREEERKIEKKREKEREK